MNYELMDTKYTESYTKAYLKALENKREQECFIGEKAEYRMMSRESMMSSITDMRVLLEYCIYPLYVGGYREIDSRIKTVIHEVIDKGDVLGLYQVIRFIYVQNQLLKKYKNLPVVIDVEDIVSSVLDNVESLKDDMINYKKFDFDLYPKNMYEMIQGMVKKIKEQ